MDCFQYISIPSLTLSLSLSLSSSLHTLGFCVVEHLGARKIYIFLSARERKRERRIVKRREGNAKYDPHERESVNGERERGREKRLG